MLDSKDVADIKAFVDINELNLDKELATCPSIFFYFSALATDAEDLWERATLSLETYETQLAESIKKALKEDETLTQTDIKRCFRADERWLELKNAQLTTQKNFRILEKAAKALEMKSRLITSLNRRDLYKRGVVYKGGD